jgi:hypothetical protein
MRGGAPGCIGSASWGVGDTEENAQTRDCWFGPKRVPKYSWENKIQQKKNPQTTLSMALAGEVADVARFCSLNWNVQVGLCFASRGLPRHQFFLEGQ